MSSRIHTTCYSTCSMYRAIQVLHGTQGHLAHGNSHATWWSIRNENQREIISGTSSQGWKPLTPSVGPTVGFVPTEPFLTLRSLVVVPISHCSAAKIPRFVDSMVAEPRKLWTQTNLSPWKPFLSPVRLRWNAVSQHLSSNAIRRWQFSVSEPSEPH